MAQNSSKVFRTIKKYVQALEDNGVQVQKVFLYGSYAKNLTHRNSNIDIIIVS